MTKNEVVLENFKRREENMDSLFQYIARMHEIADDQAWPCFLDSARYNSSARMGVIGKKLEEVLFKFGNKNGTVQFLPVDQMKEHTGGNAIGKGLNDDFFNPQMMLELALDHNLNGIVLPPGWAEWHNLKRYKDIPLILKVSGTTQQGYEASKRPQSHLLFGNISKAVKDFGANMIGYTYYLSSSADSFQERDQVKVMDARSETETPVLTWAYARGEIAQKIGLDSIVSIFGSVCEAIAMGTDMVKINRVQPMTPDQIDYVKQAWPGKYEGLIESQTRAFKKGVDAGALELTKMIVKYCHENGVGIVMSGGSKKNPLQVLDNVFLIMLAGGDGVINGRNVTTTMKDIIGFEDINPWNQDLVIAQTKLKLLQYPRPTRKEADKS